MRDLRLTKRVRVRNNTVQKSKSRNTRSFLTRICFAIFWRVYGASVGFTLQFTTLVTIFETHEEGKKMKSH